MSRNMIKNCPGQGNKEYIYSKKCMFLVAGIYSFNISSEAQGLFSVFVIIALMSSYTAVELKNWYRSFNL